MITRVGSWEVRSVGEVALLVDAHEVEPARLASALAAGVARGGLVVTDIVVGAETVLVIVGGPRSRQRIGEVLAAISPVSLDGPDLGTDSEVIEIPVRYDGADLDDVARIADRSTAEVVALHSSGTYKVAFVGFAPGFAYLTGLPPALHVSRLSQPRPVVPAGSVAIADTYSAVYPRSSPGGWRLLGTSPAVLFDVERRPAAVLGPGAVVRFVETARARTGRAGPPDPQAVAPGGSVGPALEVIDAGTLTTIQDQGRAGHAGEGVPPSGAADGASARLANRLVGNNEDTAVLETTLSGPTLRLRGPAGSRRAVAVTGAVGPITAGGVGQGANAPFDLVAGDIVALAPVDCGLRSYLAISGGVDVEPVLGSRSSDVLSGLGPPALGAGQMLSLGPDAGRRAGVDVAPVASPGRPAFLRVGPGPRSDWLTEEARVQLRSATWTVVATSNRIGVRLEGPVLARTHEGELAPEGLVTGAVQLTPADELVVFLKDHPVTGGYPVIGVVHSADLGIVAQLRPGEAVQLL